MWAYAILVFQQYANKRDWDQLLTFCIVGCNFMIELTILWPKWTIYAERKANKQLGYLD